MFQVYLTLELSAHARPTDETPVGVTDAHNIIYYYNKVFIYIYIYIYIYIVV